MREQELATMSSSQLQEELEKALKSVNQAKSDYEDACKQGIFARFGETAKAKKELISGAEVYETHVRSALFKANQSETLSSLSQESLNALAMYYDSSNPDTPIAYTGQYAKEQVLQAFEKQGLGTDDATFSQIYEYYRFAADEQRAMIKQTQLQEQYANASGLEKVGMNLQTIATSPIRGFSAMSEMIEAGLGYHDENAPLNINDRAFDLTNYSNTVRSETSQDIAEATGNCGVANFAYNTTMGIGDNAMNMVMLGGLGSVGVLTSMGANAASESAKDATLRGIGVEDALKTGLVSGVIEVAAEKIPVSRVMKQAGEVGTESLNNVAKNIFKQSSIEGAEEAVTSIGNTVSDYAINQKKSHYSLNKESYMEAGMTEKEAIMATNQDVVKDMVEAGASGFISGGIMEGGAYVISDVSVSQERLAQVTEYADMTFQKYNTADDIIDYVDNWRVNNGIADDVKLTDAQMDKFIVGLHEEIGKMDFSVPKGTTIIGYSGSHGIDDENPARALGAWKIARETSKKLGDNATYISDLPAGKLIGDKRNELKDSLSRIVGENENLKEQIISGYKDGKRLDIPGTCGIGNNRLSLDDLVSSKLMGETREASDNLIVLIPQPIEEQWCFHEKVFAVTELEQIFKNDTFKYINGIPKEHLKDVYKESEIGKESMYNIISKTSQEVVGNDMTLDGQSDLLVKAITEDGILTKERATYTVNKCYDKYNNLNGVELLSKNQEQALINAPEETISKVGYEVSLTKKLGKDFNIFKPLEKMKMYRDMDGNIQVGEPEKFVITKGLDGELKIEKGALKDIEKPFEKISVKEFIK